MQKLISSVKNNLMKGHAMANHMIYFTNGTKCDVTGLPRTAIAKVRACILAMATKSGRIYVVLSLSLLHD